MERERDRNQIERLVDAARAVAEWRIDPARFTLPPDVAHMYDQSVYTELSEAARTGADSVRLRREKIEDDTWAMED